MQEMQPKVELPTVGTFEMPAASIQSIKDSQSAPCSDAQIAP